MNYVTPAGFRDVLTDEAQQRERITRAVQERFAARGYLPIETPTLEVMDVMRAGGRLAGSPFRFFDARGDLLAMRPDVTLQVARMTATRLAGQPGPFRFRYLQRVFREAEAEMQAKARELTQMGIECIGEEGPEADAEVVGLLAEALDVAGARGYTLALATVGVLRALLEASGAPAWWKEQVLDAYHASNFVELDRLTAPAGAGPAPDAEPGARASVPPVFAAAIRALPRIRGGRAAIDEVRALVAPLGCEDGLDAFARTYDLLEEAGLGERILVDFSVMSSFDYYTGLVFEAYAPGLGTPLGSGGRYDNMIAAYGESRPAAGFAFFLEQAMAAAATVPVGCENAPSVPAAPNPCPLRIAVPKGSLNGDTIAALAAAGLDVAGLANPGRQLIIKNPGVEYVIVRPTDAPTFVALGAADCGICGKDSLLEADSDVVELVDLAFGACRFVVAEPAAAAGAADERYRELGSIRVATKYPGITAAHFARQGREVEIVKLHGNIELAPLTGMAERIVDITATGTTLAENDLVVVEEVLSSTARFFANACAFRTDERIVQLTQALAQAVQAAPQAQDDPAPQVPTKQG
ncbi:MAG TPA: ATP phosphoribosyltransferase regulatory subunit [Gordonibacter urolithinfaciens]|uniref:ATP phosphoribosyltransferase regulatory subunit n=1 Tax=Gordonibacter TaxID=644652 RepID=UPI001D463F87|nr:MULTISPECIES: ATP phosphoribosyltransferase regulatory subunit [Gordonibacter]MDN4510066.1 ATP phosphoribosyltransferase regulatory subunit [Gordonibacter sp. RACS_AR49]HJF63683.1 ATP phosphoribosyltransferase regulatory subunit [Gordonibacter urolithinfaciens]